VQSRPKFRLPVNFWRKYRGPIGVKDAVIPIEVIFSIKTVSNADLVKYLYNAITSQL